MNKIKFVLLAAIFIAMAFTFASCGEVGGGGEGSSSGDGGGSSSSGGSSSGGDFPESSSSARPVDSCDDYDKLTQFCWGDKAYERCGGEEYDPNTRFCYGNKFYLKCGGEEYNPLIQFCFDEKEAYLRCEGKERDPLNEFCFDGSVVPKCADVNYNPDEEFCVEGKLEHKCGGNEFYPSEQFCLKSKLYSICDGDSNYDPLAVTCCGGKKIQLAGNFCFEERSYPKCASETYNPLNEFCESEQIYQMCGGEKYDPSERFCFEDKFYLLCGGEKYDPVQQICFKGNGDIQEMPYLRCGGKPADPDYEFCFDNNIYPRCRNRAEEYNPFENFCFQDELYPMCGDLSFTPTVQFCHRLKIFDLCGVTYEEYDPDRKLCFRNGLYSTQGCLGGAEFCDDEGNYKRCGNDKYNIATQFCDGGFKLNLCGSQPYDPAIKFCFEARSEIIDLCSVKIGTDDFGRPIYELKPYDFDTEDCRNYAIVNKYFNQECGKLEEDEFCCFGKKYSTSSNYFCSAENELYTKCNGDVYEPRESICFNGDDGDILMPNCSNPGVTGICAYSNSLLRCKQLGNGYNYARDPLPGMSCQTSGAITGKIEIEPSVKYNIVQIGDQIWMAENLKEDLSGRCYNDNCGDYGKLYDWAEIFQVSCPKDFHIPDTADWQKLARYVGGASVAGGRLKSMAPGWNGADNYGFNALPGGYEVYWGNDEYGYLEQGSISLWWTATSVREDPNTYYPESSNAYYFGMISSDTELRTHYRPKDGGAYVRCMRDAAF